jgi:hypothetical protein
MEPFAWSQEDIRGIAAPTLIIVGDSDAIRLEHAVELFRLLGGGVMGTWLICRSPNSLCSLGLCTSSPPAVGFWTAPIGWLR